MQTIFGGELAALRFARSGIVRAAQAVNRWGWRQMV
jgi:hypothetical protein